MAGPVNFKYSCNLCKTLKVFWHVTLIKKLLLLFGHLVKEEYDIEDLDHKVAHKVKWG